MSIAEIKKALVGTFQGMLKNIVSLANGSTLEKDLKVLKVGEKSTPIQLSESEVSIKDATLKYNDSEVITTGTNTFTSSGDITLDPDGSLLVTGADLTLNATKKIIFDGILTAHTYIQEVADDRLHLVVGGDTLLELDEGTGVNTFAGYVHCPRGLYIDTGRTIGFDGASGHTLIAEVTDDQLLFDVGGQNMMVLVEDATTSVAQSSKIYHLAPTVMKDIGGVADTPASGYGSLYVNSDVLYFKTDGGTVTNLLAGGGGSTFRDLIKGGFNYSYTGGTKVYLPLVGYVIERTSTTGQNDFVGFVAPYDGYLNQVVFRSEEVCGSTVVGLHKSSTGTEVPSSTASNSVTVDMTTDDTPYKFSFGDSASFSAGEILAISFDPTNDANDTNFTAEFIFDSSEGL